MQPLTETEKKELVEAARIASQKAYAPYSSYRVGAALLTRTGKIFTGCNVENASYSLTVCAERNAVFQAVAEGEKEFMAIAIYADSDTLFPPCGACRQVLSEFADNMLVFIANRLIANETTLDRLLPDKFSLINAKKV